MAYSKQTWVRGEKVASTKLNHMEDGIAAISANGAIDTANLANGAVTLAKLADAVKEYFATADDVSGLKSDLDTVETMAEIDLSEQDVTVTTNRKYSISIVSKTIKTNTGSNWWLTNPIPVVAGDLYKIWGASHGLTAVYAFADETGIQIVYPTESGTSDMHLLDGEIVKVPTGMTYMYVSSYSGSGISLKVKKIEPRTIPDAEAINEYLGDFTTNKAENPTWISGYGVYKIDANQPRSATGYYITHIDVSKGDLIKITYQEDYPLSQAYIALSEKIEWGSGALQYGFRPLIAIGSGTIQYVAEKDMTITVCGHENAHLPTIEVYESKAYEESVDVASNRFLLYPYNDTVGKLAISMPSRNGYESNYPKPLTLLHFSDIHNAFWNTERIAQFKELFAEYIDDVICSGDMCGYFANYQPIFGLEKYKNILLAIGNHDVYDADGTHDGSDAQEYWATNIQKYNQYFAPSIANWNVIQPTDAATLGLCYYYKDYSSNGYGYRLIVLDVMAFDDAQYNWLVSVLADARTNNKTVVIVEHFPPITGLSDISGFDTPFMSLLTGMEYNYKARLSTTAGNALDAVDAFINDGGEFACWLCGHMHYDQIGTITSHPNQIFVAIASANSGAVWLDMSRKRETPSVDLFNIVSIDPYYKLIKIQRIGATVDDWGRIRDHVSVNYQTKTLIATS